jgi:hypothetical protein
VIFGSFGIIVSSFSSRIQVATIFVDSLPCSDVSRRLSELKRRVADLAIFREGIASLPPAKLLASHLDLKHKVHHRDDLPKRYDATVTYTGPNGSYTESYLLDLPRPALRHRRQGNGLSLRCWHRAARQQGKN